MHLWDLQLLYILQSPAHKMYPTKNHQCYVNYNSISVYFCATDEAQQSASLTWRMYNVCSVMCTVNTYNIFTALNEIHPFDWYIYILKFTSRNTDQTPQINKPGRTNSPKMVLMCLNRLAESFLLSWIFPVDFFTSAVDRFVNMMMMMTLRQYVYPRNHHKHIITPSWWWLSI